MTFTLSNIVNMNKSMPSIAFLSNIDCLAYSENHSDLAVSRENEILVFHCDSEYTLGYYYTTAAKVKALWWDKPDTLCYLELGTPSLFKFNIEDGIAFRNAPPLLSILKSSEERVLSGISFQNLQLETQKQDLDEFVPIVPYDYVLAIIERMSIGDAENAVEAMLAPEATDDKQRAMEIRCDPLRFLRDSFEHPEKLLDLMRCTSTIITGSRATEYFCRGACIPGSDWDFYCPSDLETVAIFTYHLSRMGVKWNSLERSEEEFPDYFAMGFHLLKGTLQYNGRAIDIQCIWNKLQHRTATSCVLHFHSTLVQCFISGFAAVSLYDEYTSSKQAIHWPANDTNMSRGQRHRIYVTDSALELDEHGEPEEYIPGNEPESHNEFKILEKYQHRGFEFVEYMSKGEFAHGSGHGDIGCYGGRFRSIGDSGSRKVSFKAYLKHDQWEIPFDAYYQALDYVCWHETEHRTIPSGGVLDIDFPYKRKACTDFDKGWSGSNFLFDPIAASCSYTDEMVNNSETIEVDRLGQMVPGINPSPWLNKDFQRNEFHTFFHAYRYPC
jgi:hypothetical protein